MKVFSATTFVLILIGAVMIALVMWRESGYRPGPIENFSSMQGADAPLLLPEDGVPRSRLQNLSAWQLAMVPTAFRFVSPVGGDGGALTYRSRTFGEKDGNDMRLGNDLDGIGGSDTDLGDPVFAAADGLVVYSGEPEPEWGGVVVLAHRLEDGRIIQSMYGNLHRIEVPVGNLVARGRRIGRVGTANGHHPSRLHFEIRRGVGVDIGPPASPVVLNRLDPAGFSGNRPETEEGLSPSMLPAALDRKALWNGLEIEGAEMLGELREE